MIKVEALTRNYGDLAAVDQVSFEINQGEIVGLLGHNGAGKTTIMKMLTGYLEPTAGHIEINGRDMGTHREAIQKTIGYLPENCPVYLEMSVIDYLDYAAALHGVPEADRIQRVHNAIVSTELQTKATQLISTLSRGYRQRVGVAQAILHDPQVLILDEPTNGLDPTQIQHMRDLIRALAKNATVIISTHVLQEVQAICDRVIILRAGQKALDARMEDLRTGNRLLVGVDAEPDRAKAMLSDIEWVRSVEHLSENGSRHRYALAIDGQDDSLAVAPQVAQRIMTQGFNLYALQPERHDLETIFGEISAQEGR